jgi:hypothetical protein
MTPEELWRMQTPETAHPKIEQLQRMERSMRRKTTDLLVAMVLASATMIWLATVFRHPLVTAGAILSVAGLAFLAFEVLRHRSRAPVAENGAAGSIEYHRALLQHRIEFHRHRLWLRVVTLAPGGVIYFLGLAAARPALAPFFYVELATFFAGVALIIPANRRAAAKLERQLADLTRLQSNP